MSGLTDYTIHTDKCGHPEITPLTAAYRSGTNTTIISLRRGAMIEIPEKYIMQLLPEKFAQFTSLDNDLVERARNENVAIDMLHSMVTERAMDLPIDRTGISDKLYFTVFSLGSLVKDITVMLRKKRVPARLSTTVRDCKFSGLWPNRIVWVLDAADMFKLELTDKGKEAIAALGCTTEELIGG